MNSKHIDLVVVNTDSELVKSDIIKNFEEKVILIDRNEDIRGNYISMNKVLEQDIEKVNNEVLVKGQLGYDEVLKIAISQFSTKAKK